MYRNREGLGASPFIADPIIDIAPGPAYQLPDLETVAKRSPLGLYLILGALGFYFLVTGKAGRRRSVW